MDSLHLGKVLAEETLCVFNPDDLQELSTFFILIKDIFKTIYIWYMSM